MFRDHSFEAFVRYSRNQGFPPDALRRIILTASGGAFRDWPAEDLVKVRVTSIHHRGIAFHWLLQY